MSKEGIYYVVSETNDETHPSEDTYRLTLFRIEGTELRKTTLIFDAEKNLQRIQTPTGVFQADTLMLSAGNARRMYFYFWYKGVYAGFIIVDSETNVNSRLHLTSFDDILTFLSKKKVPVTWTGSDGNMEIVHTKITGETMILHFRTKKKKGCCIDTVTFRRPGYRASEKKVCYVDAVSLLSATTINSIPVVLEEDQDWIRTLTEEESKPLRLS